MDSVSKCVSSQMCHSYVEASTLKVDAFLSLSLSLSLLSEPRRRKKERRMLSASSSNNHHHRHYSEGGDQRRENKDGTLTAAEPSSSSPFSNFCQTTSLHGWRFLAEDNTAGPQALKFGWVLVVMAAIGVAAFFLTNSILDFRSSTVQTTQDTSR